MKKTILIITALLITTALLGLKSESHSAQNLPYPTIEGNNPSQCLQTTANELVKMRNAWNAHLKTTLAQEKPTSDMVDDAFESMRTYRCWLEYLCQAVLFSGNAGQAQMTKDAQNGVNFGSYLKTVPSCTKASNVEIPGTKLKYLSHCHVDSGQKFVGAIVQTQFNECQALIRAEFADPSEAGSLKVGTLDKAAILRIKNNSSASIGLESALRTKSAAQKSRILQEKLNSLLNRMQGMHSNINILAGHMSRFDQKLPCIAAKCD